MTGRVYARDALKAGFCRGGIKLKCEMHGIDFQSFRKNGLPIEEVEAVDDVQLKRTVEAAKARIRRENRDVD